MSIRSSEVDDDAMGERYARRSAEEANPFNPIAGTNAARKSDEESLFSGDNEDERNFDNSNGIQENDGNAIFPQAREVFPQARETTTHHGHATRATTRIRTPGDDSVASSVAPRNNAFAPITNCTNI